MRVCSACGNQYSDDANFCPMDATRLPPPAAAAPSDSQATVSMPAASTMQNQLKPVAGRFAATGPTVQTPTGLACEAQDSQTGGQVLLKLVSPEVLPTNSMIDRALRELKQLAKITSERIVRVIDQGKTEEGQVYIATELVPGVTLEESIAREGALPVDRAIQIVLEIGEALTEAQKVGVIHRDVAPRNVFVLPNGRVKVGDFGLAERITEKVFGAPSYLSPEQVEGRPVDQRSNIYSLGAIFYHALTGRPPFEGDSARLLDQHAHAAPEAPSSKRPGGLPAEIDRVVLKALEKTGGRRHLTLRQLLTEIEGAAGKAQARVDPMATANALAAAQPASQARPMAATMMGIPPSPAAGAAQAAAEARTLASPLVAAALSSPAPAEQRPLQQPAAVQAAVAAAAVKRADAATQQKGGFRETAWFKKGEIEEEMAKAEAAHAVQDPLATAATGKKAVLDESQIDVSAQDRARLSLKTGATQAMQAIKGPAVPGERMDEAEMLAEIDSSKKWFLIAGAIVALAILGVVLYFLFASGGSPAAESPPSPKPEAVAAAPPPSPKLPAAAPSAPASPAPSSSSAAQLLTDEAQALRKDDLAGAVTLLERAADAGASAKDLKKAEMPLSKALTVRALRAKKRKEKSIESEVRGLAARLKGLKPRKK